MNVFNDFIDNVLRCATKNQKLVYLRGLAGEVTDLLTVL